MIDEKILNDLEKAQNELNDIDKALSSGNIDSNEIKELSKKRNTISDVVGYFIRYKEIQKSIKDNKELLNDEDFKELAQEEIDTLNEELKSLKSSNETANIKTSALSAISNSGAVNAEQMLSLLQDRLKRNDNGDVVVLNGGVEQDLGTYIGNLKNPGSGWEHHFKPSSAAGMGAKPSPTSNVSPGMPNPWKEGTINITRQMTLESTEPDLAAVLKKEAQSG